ncbi:hypothetical protein BDU57DRAFT_546203 [Ampelomyces quisqualis]|uniref:DUF1763-domain-containing protein n=1 Tax=Ampelomyces quisqualis TaxID=50730 RepID=A0A6A5QY38_AMPQU|nr:hypothetical protein BDU57DRAFT_546203 [Ampelomyces quisqualis]
MASESVIHAYRHLYRQGLRAVQFSKPARYTLRDRLRLAFRKGCARDLEPQRVANTLEFLLYATKENGIEHKIVKNLLLVWWSQKNGGRGKPKARIPTREEIEIKTTAYDTFNHNIRMLNESMDMCLPAMTVRDPN